MPRDPRERPLPLNQSDHGKYPSARAEIRKALKLREQFQRRKEEQKDRRPKHESFRRSKHDGGLQNDLRRMQKQDCGAPFPPHCGQKQGDQIRSGDAILTGVVDVPHLAVNRFRPTPHGPRSTMPRSKARMHLWRAVDTAASAPGTIARSMGQPIAKVAWYLVGRTRSDIRSNPDQVRCGKTGAATREVRRDVARESALGAGRTLGRAALRCVLTYVGSAIKRSARIFRCSL